MQTVVRIQEPARQIQRQLLRALNGAALGAVLGSLIGGALGGASAFFVDALSLILPVERTYCSQAWMICAVTGMLPAVPAGGLLGSSIIIRNESRRLRIGMIWGLFVGSAYALFWSGAVGGPQWLNNNLSIGRYPLVIGAIVISGPVGGLSLALILTVIRQRWKWWTRWEDESPLA